MNDDGYTLVEMLVALVLAGLAVSAVSMTARIVSHAEDQLRSAHTTSMSLGRFTDAAGAALRNAGPFATTSPADFVGSPEGAMFDCGDERCAIEVAPNQLKFASPGAQRSYAVPRLKRPGLEYVSAKGGRSSSRWPPAGRQDRLTSVVLTDAGRPIVNLMVRVEQPRSCAFDAASKDCAVQVAP